MIDSSKINLYLETEQTSNREDYDYVIWTGPIDEAEHFPYRLKWRGTTFLYTNYDFFGPRLAPVYNLCCANFRATRSTDMDMLTGGDSGLILEEIPGSEDKYYPIHEDGILEKIDSWIEKEEKENRFYCGRLGTFRYLDMDDTIENALEITKKILNKEALCQ